jgi:putative aldouronate transport system substrate-binding protein
MKKVLLISLMIAVVVTVGFAAAQSEEAPGATERPEVSVLIWRNGSGNYPDDSHIKGIIEERLQIELNTILVLSADMAQKKATLIASGDIPDIMPFNLDEMYDGVANGLISPLDDLLESNGPHLLKNITEELWDTCRVDGKIYATPSFSPWSQVPCIRKDWLDKLGIEETFFKDATLEDYYTVLKRFRDEDPDGNGEDDTIPFAAAGADLWQFDFIWAAFGYRIFELYENEGKVVHGALFPELKDGIEFIRRLYQEQILDPEFAITTNKLVRSKYSSGKVGFYYHNFALLQDHHPVNKELWAKVPSALFIGVEPPIGPDGQRGCMKRSPSGLHTRSVVTTVSKSPETAVRYLDFICSDEGWMLTKFGMEGEHYSVADDGKTVNYLVDSTERINAGVGAYQIQTKPPFPAIDGVTPIAQEAMYEVGFEYGTYGIQLAKPAASAKDFDAGLRDIINEHYLRMMVEEGDLNEMFDRFVKVYMENGGDILGTERYEIYKAQ